VAHARAVDPVDAGDRASVDRKRQRRLGIETERQPQCRANRAAMGYGDKIAAGMVLDQAVDRSAYPRGDRHETFATRRRLMRWRMPKAMEIAVARLAQRVIGKALPFAEILFGEVRHRDRLRPGDRLRPRQTGADDRRRRLMSAA
jgi:hypothetical protein